VSVAHFRRQQALAALAKVSAGARGADAETELVDFKLEAGSRARHGVAVEISARDDHAAKELAKEAACFSNSPQGGILVVGVDDKKAGPDAFIGTRLDTEWLRRRIWEMTQPSLSLAEIELLTYEGQRIYLIDVPPGMEEIRVDGKLLGRRGTDCVELSGDAARQLLEERRRFDWSADPSGLHVSDVKAEALVSAQNHYRERRGEEVSGLEVMRRMGVLTAAKKDPELTNAGALLFCDFEPHLPQLDLIWTVAEGAPSLQHDELRAPLLPSIDAAFQTLESWFQVESQIVGLQRREFRNLPLLAVREAIVNAVTHRDYRLTGPVHVTTVGDPANTLKVISPGGFVPGVDSKQLISTPSRPRNPLLASAMRVLGIGEGEGIGIDGMYREMLRDGHPEPEITQTNTGIVCRLSGGRVDLDVRAFFDGLVRANSILKDDVRTTLAVMALTDARTLRPEVLADIAQCTEGEAFEALEQLERAGAVERLMNGARSFRLTKSALSSLASRIHHQGYETSSDRQDATRALLDVDKMLSTAQVAEALHVHYTQAQRIIKQMVDAGELVTVGKPRGRGVRYTKAKRG
jgi:ATP-dependent DNA helicase RecG